MSAIDKLRAQIRDRDLEVYTGGYAQAVADIRQVLHDLVLEQESLIGGAALLCAIDRIKSGAHVGAAKKGAT